jgi:hypothetical protein
VLPFAFGLFGGADWQTIFTDPWSRVGAAVELFVVLTAQVFGLAVKELRPIEAVVGNVVDDIGGGSETELEAPRAQRLQHELKTAAPPPTAMVIRAAAIVTALATAARVERIGRAHGRMLARALN